MNKCIFGAVRLTRDPEIRYSEAGKAVARFNIAIDRRYKTEGQPTADFVNCIAFSHNAEFAEKYLKKGTKVNIEAHVQTGSYVNKDGQTVYTTDFIVDGFEFCESRGGNGSETSAQTQAAPTPTEQLADFVSVVDSVEAELPFH